MPNSNQPERIQVHEARADMSDLVKRVMQTRQPVVLTCHGKDMVKIVPLDGDGTSVRERFPDYFAK